MAVSSSPASIAALASAISFVHKSRCLRTMRSTDGLTNWYCSVEYGAGPEMISGVRASSIRIESTSSTMA